MYRAQRTESLSANAKSICTIGMSHGGFLFKAGWGNSLAIFFLIKMPSKDCPGVGKDIVPTQPPRRSYPEKIFVHSNIEHAIMT